MINDDSYTPGYPLEGCYPQPSTTHQGWLPSYCPTPPSTPGDVHSPIVSEVQTLYVRHSNLYVKSSTARQEPPLRLSTICNDAAHAKVILGSVTSDNQKGSLVGNLIT